MTEPTQHGQRVDHGLAADEILEREAGGVHHVATILCDLESACYAAYEEFRYHSDNEAAAELSRLLEPLSAHLDRVSVMKDGGLTLHRECRRCSGIGRTSGEDPCIECGGSGSVHGDEADG